MRDIGSVFRGIKAIKKPYVKPEPKWAVHWLRYNKRLSCSFWTIWWTPVWHEGRGPYISIGLGLFAIYRGY